jgi:hypothetical protein
VIGPLSNAEKKGEEGEMSMSAKESRTQMSLSPVSTTADDAAAADAAAAAARLYLAP